MKSFWQNTEIHTNCMKREDFAMQLMIRDNDFYILLKESTTTRIRLVAFSGLLFIKIDQSVEI